MNYIKEYFVSLWTLTIEMAPYLVFGFFIAGLLHLYLQKEKVGKMLNGNNFKSVLNATILGIPLPLCSCGVIPAGLSFAKNGSSKGATVSFLISTPQTGVDSVLATYSLLGLPFAIIRPLVALVTGLVGGSITNSVVKEKPFVNSIKVSQQQLSFIAKLKEVIRYGFVELIQDISKWLIIGLAAAALLAVMIPDDFFTTYIDKPILSMLMVLVASVPLYICATGSIPIAAVLMLKGLSPGAALVLLMAGPATNIATLTVLWKELGKKATLVYLVTIIGGALIFAFIIDTFLPVEWFAFAGNAEHQHHFLPEWLSYASAIFLLLLIVNGYIKTWIQNRKTKKNRVVMEQFRMIEKFKVEGMTCKNCKAHVERDLQQIEGIENVVANFENDEVSITGNVSLETVKDVVEKSGYIFIGRL